MIRIPESSNSKQDQDRNMDCLKIEFRNVLRQDSQECKQDEIVIITCRKEGNHKIQECAPDKTARNTLGKGGNQSAMLKGHQQSIVQN